MLLLDSPLLLLWLTGGAGSSAEGLHVSAEQVEEYERYYQRFWAAVKGRMHKVCARNVV